MDWGNLAFIHPDSSPWLNLFYASNYFYSWILLPITVGVLVTLAFRVEHADGGWKQMLTLPISRSKFFLKFIIVSTFLLLLQFILILGIFTFGMLLNYHGAFPWYTLFVKMVIGWVSVLPLLTLQLWVSFLWKNFAAPFGLLCALTIPAILIAQSRLLSPWYPWSQPFLVMNAFANNWWSTHPASLYLVILGSFVLFFVGSYLHFVKQDWT